MYRFLLFSLVCVSLVSFGCSSNQTLKDAWKYTQVQYRSYLNTPVAVDLTDTGSNEEYELALGEAVSGMDAALQKMLRSMENSDRDPGQAWVFQMMTKYPWLSGLMMLDEAGKTVARHPENFAKTFDPEPLLTPDPKQHISAIRASVQKSEHGAEVYIANPLYAGTEQRGLIIAHFDPRALAMRTADPDKFMLIGPDGVLWPGKYEGAGVITQADWAAILRSRSYGVISGGGQSFYFTTRYLGNMPLVYAIATDVKPTKKLEEEAKAEEAVVVPPAPAQQQSKRAASLEE